jgi:Polyketide cyclase / dehydrase and lipid transport
MLPPMLIEPIQDTADGLRADLHVDAPVGAVSDYVGDLRNMPTWWPEHPVYRRLRGEGGAGSLYAWIYRVGGFPFAGFSRVLVREAGERFEYRAGPPVVGIRIGYRFTPDRDGTRVAFSFLTPLGRVPAFAHHLVPEVTRALDRLAGHLASASRGVAA